METQTVEHNILIATRNPPGDNWVLIDDKKKINHSSLTDALEAYFQKTGEGCHFRLEPLNGKLFAIKESEEEIVQAPPKRFNIYGDY